jgi:hypothetical protein
MLLYYLYYSTILTSGYAFIESSYRYYNKKKYTTLGQTIITFSWSPIIINHVYYFQNYNIENYGILLFPFNIWLCEITCGYLFLYIFNKRFWNYNDNLTYFNKMISLYFYPHWLFLGIIINYLFAF